jgi:prolyl-tRNA synthetase
LDEKPRKGRWYLERVGALLALFALLALTIFVTSQKDTNNTETGLWTFILFAIGLGVSFYFGKKSVTEAAADIVRPQARSAARRLVTLGEGIGAFKQSLDQHRVAAHAVSERDEGAVPIEDFDLACDALDIQVRLQTKMVIDALEDWRQFDPDFVNELMEDQGDE